MGSVKVKSIAKDENLLRSKLSLHIFYLPESKNKKMEIAPNQNNYNEKKVLDATEQ